MPYSIQESLEDTAKQLESERAVAEKFPDAYLSDLPNGHSVWVSENANPTDVEIVGDGRSFFFCPYEIVGIHRVYVKSFIFKYAILVLKDLKTQKPEAYEALVALAK